MSIFSAQHSVSVQDVKSHLLLMSAFQIILQKVEKSGVHLDSSTGLPIPTSDAVIFLARSLRRFEIWITTLETSSVESGLKDHEIPPIDVLMFLHAYMLNPLDFYEDSHHRHKVLGRVAEFPLSRVAHLIDKQTMEYAPTEEQVRYWGEKTSLPFDIPFDGPVPKTFSVACPRCETEVAIQWVDVTVPNHPSHFSGSEDYATPVFNANCPECQLNVTPNALRVGRFLRDNHSSCVTHTLLDDTGALPDFKTAHSTSLQISEKLGPDLNHKTAGDKYDWDIEQIFKCLSTRLDQSSVFQRNFTEVVNAYSHPSDFAVDLSKAVFRQARFIFQMSVMGWLEPGRFDEKDDALRQAMRYYDQFLSLNPVGIIARWDLDLIWHTHQLSGRRYRDETLRILGHVLDHDDTQSQGIIANGAQNSEAVWKAKFGESYLTPSDPDLVASLAKTVCGGSSGGSCFPSSPNGGGSGGGSGGGGSGGGKESGRAGHGRPQSVPLGEFQSLEVLAN